MNPADCNIFWGSHGCDREVGHDGMHHCKSCCNLRSIPHWTAHRTAEATQYGADGCAGTWPYYGRDNMTGEDAALPFFTYEGKTGFVNLPDEFARLEALLDV